MDFLKDFASNFKGDLLLNLVTGGQAAVAKTAFDKVKDFATLNKGEEDLLDLGKSEREIVELRDEKERLRKQRQPGRRQTLLSVNNPESTNLLKGF